MDGTLAPPPKRAVRQWIRRRARVFRETIQINAGKSARASWPSRWLLGAIRKSILFERYCIHLINNPESARSPIVLVPKRPPVPEPEQRSLHDVLDAR